MAKKAPAPTGVLTERFDLMRFTDDLLTDLTDLRAGKISAKDALARAELARNVLRSVHLVITARKFIESQAKELPAP